MAEEEDDFEDTEDDELYEAVVELQDRVVRQDRSLAQYMRMFSQMIQTLAIALDEEANEDARKAARTQIKQVAINLGSYQKK